MLRKLYGCVVRCKLVSLDLQGWHVRIIILESQIMENVYPGDLLGL